MNKRKVLLLSIVILVVVGATAAFFLNKVNYVDPNPAMEFGTKFFDSFKSNPPIEAFSKYSPDFRTAQGQKWNTFLKQFNLKYGTVISSELRGMKMIPIKGQACFALSYNIQRPALATHEQIIICPIDDMEMAAVGHEIIRLDKNQKISAGISFTETGVKFP